MTLTCRFFFSFMYVGKSGFEGKISEIYKCVGLKNGVQVEFFPKNYKICCTIIRQFREMIYLLERDFLETYHLGQCKRVSHYNHPDQRKSICCHQGMPRVQYQAQILLQDRNKYGHKPNFDHFFFSRLSWWSLWRLRR